MRLYAQVNQTIILLYRVSTLSESGTYHGPFVTNGPVILSSGTWPWRCHSAPHQQTLGRQSSLLCDLYFIDFILCHIHHCHSCCSWQARRYCPHFENREAEAQKSQCLPRVKCMFIVNIVAFKDTEIVFKDLAT